MLEIGIDINIVDENCQCESGPPSNTVATPEYETTTPTVDCSLYQQWDFISPAWQNVNTSDPTTDPCVTESMNLFLSTDVTHNSTINMQKTTTETAKNSTGQKTIIFASIGAILAIVFIVVVFALICCRYMRRLRRTNNNLTAAMTRLTSNYSHLYDELNSIRELNSDSVHSYISFAPSIKSQYSDEYAVASVAAQTEPYLHYDSANNTSN